MRSRPEDMGASKHPAGSSPGSLSNSNQCKGGVSTAVESGVMRSAAVPHNILRRKGQWQVADVLDESQKSQAKVTYCAGYVRQKYDQYTCEAPFC